MFTVKWNKHYPRKKKKMYYRAGGAQHKLEFTVSLSIHSVPEVSHWGKDCATPWFIVKFRIKIWENLSELGITMERNGRKEIVSVVEGMASGGQCLVGVFWDLQQAIQIFKHSEVRGRISRVQLGPRVGAYLWIAYYRPDTIPGTRGIVVNEAHFPLSYTSNLIWNMIENNVI